MYFGSCVCACVRAQVCVCVHACVLGITAKTLEPKKSPNLACGLQVTGLALMTACGCGNGCVFFIATSTGSCFGCQKPIKRTIRPKFEVWSSSTRIRNINHIGCGLVTDTPTGSCFAIN